MPRPDRARVASGSDGQLQRRRCSSSWPTRAMGSTHTSTRMDEAQRLFREGLVWTLQTVALDARAQVAFDREAVAAYRLVGYENRDMADQDFTNDEVDAGAIGAGHSVTALYALRLRERRRTAGSTGCATVSLRWTDPGPRLVPEADPRRADQRPRAVVRRHRSVLPLRRDRGGHGRGPSRQPVDRAAGLVGHPADVADREDTFGLPADGPGPRVPRPARRPRDGMED